MARSLVAPRVTSGNLAAGVVVAGSGVADAHEVSARMCHKFRSQEGVRGFSLNAGCLLASRLSLLQCHRGGLLAWGLP